MTVATSASHRKISGDDSSQTLAKFCDMYFKYGRIYVLLGALANNCGNGDTKIYTIVA